MEFEKINLNEIIQDGGLVLPIGNITQPLDNTFNTDRDFIDKSVEESINSIIDYEKIRFVPSSGYTEIVVKLMVSGSTELTYEDLGFTNEDIKFRRNRWKRSFVKLNFYDTNNLSNQRLAFQSLLFSQINEDQRDVNNKLLDVSNMPVTFRLKDPIKEKNGISEGFYLYWLKNIELGYPINFYMYATYNNASNGQESQLISYDGVLNINEYNQFNWVDYEFVSINNLNQYFIKNNSREINFLSDRIEILLYPLNLT